MWKLCLQINNCLTLFTTMGVSTHSSIHPFILSSMTLKSIWQCTWNILHLSSTLSGQYFHFKTVQKRAKKYVLKKISFSFHLVKPEWNFLCSEGIQISLRSGIFANTAWKVSKYGAFSGPYFPVFGLNTGKYEPEKTSYFDTFHAVESWNSYGF